MWSTTSRLNDVNVIERFILWDYKIFSSIDKFRFSILLRKKTKLMRLTYCPSNMSGGLTGHFCNALGLLTLTIHRSTSGFRDPGVGYRTVRVSGNDVLLILCTAITAPVSNHGYTIVPTWVSLNDANIICDPSSELQIASGVANISSVPWDCGCVFPQQQRQKRT